jgi:hypothetical protein
MEFVSVLPTGKMGAQRGNRIREIVALFATAVVLPVLALPQIAKVTNL